MMGMSASDSAVWLHTACLWNAADKEDKSQHNDNESISSSVFRAWNEILSTAFFHCNIVAASVDAPRVLDLSDSQLLPCGGDNLLLLQNLRSDNTKKGIATFQIMLSECYMIPPSSGDASRMYSSNDDSKHDGSVDGWQIDVSPSTFHWTEQQVFHQETVTINLTNAFETFRATHSTQERKQASTDPTQLRTNKFPVVEPYRIGTSSPTIEGMCWKDDMQPKHAAAENPREAWEELLKQSIENEMHQIDFVLIFLAVIAFVLSLFFIWEVIGYFRKYNKNPKRSSWFSISPVPSSIAPVSSTPAHNKSDCDEPTSVDGVVAAPTTLDISPLSLDPVFASSQGDRVRKHYVNPEEAPEETPFRTKTLLRPTNSKHPLTPSIVSPEREQYLPTSFTSSTSQPSTFLTHGGQRQRQLTQQQQLQPAASVPRTVFAKCYRPSEGRFVLRPIPITPPPRSAPRIEPSSKSTTLPTGNNVNVLRGDNNNQARSTLARRGPGLESTAGASFVHDYWCD